MRKSDWNHSRELFLLAVSLIVIFIYFSPYFIWGQDCLIRIGDNLDANIPYYKIIAHNAHEFGWSHSEVPQVMNGLPKASFLTQRNLTYLLFYIFPAFTAYVIHLILLAVIAFTGMLLLLKKLYRGRSQWHDFIIIYGVALCFSILPFYPSAGISIAGQPLLFLVFLNISKGNLRYWNYIIILLFPFYSSIVFIGVFVLIILGLWAIYILLYDRKHFPPFFLASFLLLSSYLFTERELVRNFLLRTGFDSIVDIQGLFVNSFSDAIKETIQLLIYGFPAHAIVFQFPVILAIGFLSVLILLSGKNDYRLRYFFLTGLIILFATCSAFFKWSGLTFMKELIPLLKSFDFSRISFFLPFLFYLLFFYSLKIIKDSFKGTSYATIIISCIILIQSGLILKRNTNDRTLYYTAYKLILYDRKTDQELTYKQYYSENLFKEVKGFIGTKQNDYRTLALGLDPGVLLYNGFYTLDGYNSYYPLEYKNSFRKIIAKEIEKSELIRIDFDIEGSLCYLFSSELTRGRLYTKKESATIKNLEINSGQIKNMGGRYIISAVEIENHLQNSLSFLRTFEDGDSLYRIFLYEVI